MNKQQQREKVIELYREGDWVGILKLVLQFGIAIFTYLKEAKVLDKARYISIPKGMTRDNLWTIYRKIEVPENWRFGMEGWGIYYKLTRADVDLGKCDTVGCALGYVSMIPEFQKYVDQVWVYQEDRGYEVFNYSRFIEILLPDLSLAKFNRSAWVFLFSSDWAEYDNTLEGFKRRVKLLLDGKVPIDWSFKDYKNEVE